MKTIKFYKTKGFTFQETLWQLYTYANGEEVTAPYYITHTVPSHTAIVNGNKVYFGYTLHDLPPAPSMIPDPTFEGPGKNAEADDNRFYLRKGTDRIKPIIEDDIEIGIKEYYQKHCLDFFNKGGLTYILFDRDFGGGRFEAAANRMIEGRKRLDRNNLHYKPKPEGLIGLNWV